MLDNIFTLKNYSNQRIITYKMLISAGLVVLAVLLPQIVHTALGQPGGIMFLPMYLPILIGGCLLGVRWALITAVLSPVISFLLTSALGNPMPALPRLPFMIVELAVFAAVSGLFSRKIFKNALWAVPAVILAQIAGRGILIALVALFQNIVPFTPDMIWSQLLEGWAGLLIQLILVPILVIGLRTILLKDNENE